MTPANTASELFTGRFNEGSTGLDVLPKLAGLPLGKLYAGYLLFRLIRSENSSVADLEQGLKAKVFQNAPSDFNERLTTEFTAYVVESHKTLAEAQRVADTGMLYSFLTVRFTRVVRKKIALVEAALNQLTSRVDKPYSYEELNDPEEHAFFQALTSKPAGGG